MKRPPHPILMSPQSVLVIDMRKASEHNEHTEFVRIQTGSGVINFVFYHLSSALILLPSQICSQLPFSTSTTTIDRVRRPLALGGLIILYNLSQTTMTPPSAANLSAQPPHFHRQNSCTQPAASNGYLLSP